MCPLCQNSRHIIKDGFYQQKSKRKAKVQRLRCASCKKRFSRQTHSPTYRERKSHINQPLFRLLTAGLSQRKCAEILSIHPTTVARKLTRMGRQAALKMLKEKMGCSPNILIFDEMETFEHSKCKPISIVVAVEKYSRRILFTSAQSMPAKGLLAEVSRKKYGPRADNRGKALKDMCQVLSQKHRITEIWTDQSPRYPSVVRKYFPDIIHRTTKGRRGCVVGQGELKGGGFDPIFSLNHTCAMFRDNLKTLTRRTWCTVKKISSLQNLLNLYMYYHNERLKTPRRIKVRLDLSPI